MLKQQQRQNFFSETPDVEPEVIHINTNIPEELSPDTRRYLENEMKSQFNDEDYLIRSDHIKTAGLKKWDLPATYGSYLNKP